MKGNFIETVSLNLLNLFLRPFVFIKGLFDEIICLAISPWKVKLKRIAFIFFRRFTVLYLNRKALHSYILLKSTFKSTAKRIRKAVNVTKKYEFKAVSKLLPFMVKASHIAFSPTSIKRKPESNPTHRQLYPKNPAC